MSRYQQLYKEMRSKNKEIFDEFKIIHNKFVEDPEKNRAAFNKVGEKVTELIRVYIDALCRTSESSGYGKFTTSLSELFMNEVKNEFSEIEEVGML